MERLGRRKCQGRSAARKRKKVRARSPTKHFLPHLGPMASVISVPEVSLNVSQERLGKLDSTF